MTEEEQYIETLQPDYMTPSQEREFEAGVRRHGLRGTYRPENPDHPEDGQCGYCGGSVIRPLPKHADGCECDGRPI